MKKLIFLFILIVFSYSASAGFYCPLTSFYKGNTFYGDSAKVEGSNLFCTLYTNADNGHTMIVHVTGEGTGKWYDSEHTNRDMNFNNYNSVGLLCGVIVSQDPNDGIGTVSWSKTITNIVDIGKSNADTIAQCKERIDYFTSYPISITCNENSIVGDSDGNGIIHFLDITMINYISGGEISKPANICCVDVNGDGVVDDLDVEFVTSYITTGSGGNVGKKCYEIDADGDGITDDSDLCPNTPAGETVDSNGCSDSQLDADYSCDACTSKNFYWDISESKSVVCDGDYGKKDFGWPTILCKVGEVCRTPPCCGDDPNEYYSASWGESDDACCNSNTDCAYNSQCYTTGTNIDISGYSFTCSSGSWVCNKYTCASLGKQCGTWWDGCYGELDCGSICDTDGDGITDDIDLCPNTPSSEIALVITDPTSPYYGCGPSEFDMDNSCSACINFGNQWDLTGGSCTGAIYFGWESNVGLNPFCCGDDNNEFLKVRSVLEGSNLPIDLNDKACCDSDNSCVYAGECYEQGDIITTTSSGRFICR